MVGEDRLADNVNFRMVDDKWIWHEVLEKEPQKGWKAKNEKVARTTRGSCSNCPKGENERRRGTSPSSFAKPNKTNEQTDVKIVVPLEVPRDTRISIEDLVYTDIESDIDELRVEKFTESGGSPQ